MSALQPAIARLCRPAVVALPLLDRAMLRLQFRIKKSAGIRVSKEVFRYISDGNAARDRGDWHAARNAYHQALLLAPKLHHIRIPLGQDRKSVVSGKSVSVRLDLGVRRVIKKKQKHKTNMYHNE